MYACIPDSLACDVFVEASGEITLEQFVIIDRLGNDATHKSEIAKMLRVVIRQLVDGVCDPILWCDHE